MMQQQIQAQRPVKRMDEAARQYETEQHEETLSRARRASKHARRVSAHAQSLLNTIAAYGV